MTVVSLEQARARYPGATSFAFGDSRALNSEILALVRSGAKTVSCDAVAGFAARDEALPQVGQTDIATDWDRVPQLAIRTTHVQQIPFDQMTEALIPRRASSAISRTGGRGTWRICRAAARLRRR